MWDPFKDFKKIVLFVLLFHLVLWSGVVFAVYKILSHFGIL